MRGTICREIRLLNCKSNLILHAVYASKIEERCDAENILFYNIGTGCFNNSAKVGIKFERSFRQPENTPQSGFSHFLSYRVTPKANTFFHWRRGTTLVKWDQVKLAPRNDFNPASIWYSMLTHPILEVLSLRRQERFGLSIRISFPKAFGIPNLATLMKPLFDGVIASFHHDGDSNDSDIREISDRISVTLQKDPGHIQKLIRDSSRAALGNRRVLWKRGDGVQWNPDDEACMVGELLKSRASVHDLCCISGELFEVMPIDVEKG